MGRVRVQGVACFAWSPEGYLPLSPKGLGFMDYGLGFRDYGLGFRV